MERGEEARRRLGQLQLDSDEEEEEMREFHEQEQELMRKIHEWDQERQELLKEGEDVRIAAAAAAVEAKKIEVERRMPEMKEGASLRPRGKKRRRRRRKWKRRRGTCWSG